MTNSQTTVIHDFSYNDGGRAEAGYKGDTRDCVCRAIAIANDMSYSEVYELIKVYAAREHISKQRKGKRSHPRTGVFKPTIRRLLTDLGWEWHPTMFIGSGTTVHLRADELPHGTLIVSVSRHITVMKNGTILDTYNPARDGTRAVYGYWSKPE